MYDAQGVGVGVRANGRIGQGERNDRAGGARIHGISQGERHRRARGGNGNEADGSVGARDLMGRRASQQVLVNERLFNALADGRLPSVQNLMPADPRGEPVVGAPLFRTLVHGHHGGLYDGKPPALYQGATALHVASWRGHAHVVSYLLQIDRGNDGVRATSVEDAYGRVPLDVASTRPVRRLLTAARLNDLRVNRFEAAAAIQRGASTRDVLPPIGEVSQLTRLTVDELWAGEEQCAVCMSEMAAGVEVLQIPRCGHAFCAQCLEMWYRTRSFNATCPMCRGPMLKQDTVYAGCSVSRYRVSVRRVLESAAVLDGAGSSG